MKHLKIDFVSDVSCGWCAIALPAIEQALHNIGRDITAEFHFQPFELNPHMPAGGENLNDHLRHKYGHHEALQYFASTHERGAEVGFDFRLDSNSRIYNTFDAHRLLHWAQLNGRQVELTHALFEAHFTENKDPGDHAVLLQCSESAQLDVVEARQVLESDLYAKEVQEAEARWRIKGIHAVPTVVINDSRVITGSRSVDTFEQLIREAIISGSETDIMPAESRPDRGDSK